MVSRSMLTDPLSGGERDLWENDNHLTPVLALMSDRRDTNTASTHVSPHVPHVNDVTAVGLDWILALPNVFIIDLPTRQVGAKDRNGENMTPSEILSAVQANNS